MGNTWSQSFPPKPKFTEKELPDQTGKVFIVTGSSSGVGKELAQILYARNGNVYVAARSEEKATKAIASIKSNAPNAKGTLAYLHLDLDDLSTIKKSANEFLAKESQLDVLFNNAGVMVPPQGSKTKQGYELQLGTNNLAPFLFTELLTPVLKATAKAKGPGAVRVVWVSSSAADLLAPQGGVEMGNLDYKREQGPWAKYGVSKGGNVLHACEYARRYGGEGIISVSLNPGNLKTELQRTLPGYQVRIFHWLSYAPTYGAYTELFAGLSPDVTMEKNGAWIAPWGRFLPIRNDYEAATKTEAEGGTGNGLKFWEWSEEQVKAYR